MHSSLPKAIGSQAFTVPAGAGNYAPERLTIGVPPTGQPYLYFDGLTALVRTGAPANCVAELWIGRLGATGVDGDFTYSGSNISTGPGARVAMPLAGYPVFQIRVRSGGTSGTATVDVTAD